MSSCRKCGGESFGRRICTSCLRDWSTMRGDIFSYLQGKYGKMNRDNHPTFIKETKRLERIWRKDPEKLYQEIGQKEIVES